MTETRSSKKENLLLNLGCNLALPILFLRKGDDWFGSSLSSSLGETPDSAIVGSILLLIAISFPIGYGVWDFMRRKKLNFFSILGALSALLTGGIGLIPGATVKMFAFKEAALPAILGIITVVTLKTERPLVNLFLYNPDVIRVDLVNRQLISLGTKKSFDQLLAKCTWLIAGTFLLSATLNYFLARWIVRTEPAIDKILFNDEVGRMMGWSFPIISLPCMIVSAYTFWILIKGIKKYTGFELEQVLKGADRKK